MGGIDVVGRKVRVYASGVTVSSHPSEDAGRARLGVLGKGGTQMPKSGMKLFAGRP